MRKYLLPLLLLAICCISNSQLKAQQSVGIGTTTPNTEAILDLDPSSPLGLLMPRLTLADTSSFTITAANDGMIFYATDINTFVYFNISDSLWTQVGSGAGGGTGADGLTSLITATPEAPGVNCTEGGQRIDIGIDDNGDSALDPGEIDNTFYVCDGADGLDGDRYATISTTSLTIGDGTQIFTVDTALAYTTSQSIIVAFDASNSFEATIDTYDPSTGVINATETNTTGGGTFANWSVNLGGAPGPAGNDGLNSLSTATPEPAGVNCSNGGQFIEVGLDDNADGALDPGEVDYTYYICDGDSGAAGVDGLDGLNSLSTSTLEAPGVNCSNGGNRIDVGLDDNADGTLQALEIDYTYFVCDGDSGAAGVAGLDGLNSLSTSTLEIPGVNCTNGGNRIDVGLDDNADGTLQALEIDYTYFVCDGDSGAAGVAGLDGLNSLSTSTLEIPGVNCTNGGNRIDVGLDDNADGTLQALEIDYTYFVCDGDSGAAGVAGLDGLNSLSTSTLEIPGVNCTTGGQRIDVGLDDNADGTLQALEIDYTYFVCDGDSGVAGLDGDRYATISTTSLTIGDGTQIFTVDTALAYTTSQSIIVAFDASNSFEATIDTYDPSTGVINATETNTTGGGTFANWSVNLGGAPGPAGNDGLNSLSTATPEPAGVNCSNGGQFIAVGLDDNADGTLQVLEIDYTYFVCDGDSGVAGVGGVDGLNSLATSTAEPPGVNCTNGGNRIDVGLDDNADGTLQALEIDNTYFVCDGDTGVAGIDGNTLLNGLVDPNVGIGVDGDFYINTTTDSIFGPKSGGIWGTGTSLVGPAGPASLQAAYDGGQTIAMTGADIDIQSSGGSNMLYLDDATENVGIGTSTPNVNYQLDVVGGDAQINGLTVGRGGGDNVNNVAMGLGALASNISGASNVAIGRDALSTSTNSFNIAVGRQALQNINNGLSNTAIGQASLAQANGTGGNVGIGFNSGGGLTTGDNNTFLGSQATAGNNTLTNSTAIGYQSRVFQNNSMVLGGIAGTRVNVSIATYLPNTKADLTLGSSDRGLQLNRVDRASLALVANDRGLTVYDSITNELIVWNGSAWESATTAGGGIPSEVSDADNDTKIQVEESPDEDIIRFDMGGTEYFRMNSGRIEVINPNGSVVIGNGTANSLISNPASTFNVVIGHLAMQGLVGRDNVSIGAQSLINANSTAARENTAVGMNSLQSLTSGFSNTALGIGAARSVTNGFDNTSIGRFTLQNNDGSQNVALGNEAGFNTTGNANIYIGNEAGTGQVGSNLLFIENSNSPTPLIYGDFANDSLKIYGSLSIGNAFTFPTADGTANQVLQTDGAGGLSWANSAGVASLQSAYDGGQSIAMTGADIDITSSGTNPVLTIDDANENVGIGTATPNANYQLDVVGGDIFVNGYTLGRGPGGQNTVFGLGTYNISTGVQNTVMGNGAGGGITQGNQNTAIGMSTLQFNTVGNRNTAIGKDALRGATGSDNVAIGVEANENAGGALSNTAIGNYSLRVNTGNNNSALGIRSGFALTGGSDNTFIGANADAGVANLINATAIGAGAIVSQNSSLVLGNNANVGIGTSTPANRLEVIGDAAKFDSVIIVNGAQAGYILTSNASGEASWQPGASAHTLQAAYDGGQTINMGSGNIDFISSGANSVLYIDELNERVGIGNTSPANPLDILNTTSASAINAVTNFNAARNEGINSLVSGSASENFGISGRGIGGTFSIGVNGEASNASSSNIGVRGVAFNSANTGWIVGIQGEVQGVTTATNAFGVNAITTTTGSTNNYGIYSTASGGTNNYAGYFENGDVIAENGKVGIGTNNPSGNLTIEADSGAGAFVLQEIINTNADGQTSLDFVNDANRMEIRYEGSNFANNSLVIFDDNDSQARLVIDDVTGDVGIGDYSPQAKLDVTDSIPSDFVSLEIENLDPTGSASLDLWNDSYAYILGLDGSSAGSATENDFYIYDAIAGADRFVINDAGNIGIGSSNPNSLFSVGNGNEFRVAADGDLTRIKNVPYVWPNANTSGVLTNDGSGNLSFVPLPGPLNSWLLGGNAGTDSLTDFIGTTDDVPLNFRINNQPAGRIDDATTGNTGFGFQSGNVGAGFNNASFGFRAMSQNSTAQGNAAFGSLAMENSVNGNANTGLGYAALRDNEGIQNTAVGNASQRFNDTGNDNVSVGYLSLLNNINSSGNTAIGSNSLENSVNEGNSGLGYFTLNANTLGTFNTAIGHFAGALNTTGTFNTFIGKSADASFNNLTNATAIGANAIVGASNSLVLGGTGVDAVNVGIGTTTPLSQLQLGNDFHVFPNNAGGGGKLISFNLYDIDGAGDIRYTTTNSASAILMGQERIGNFVWPSGTGGTVPPSFSMNTNLTANGFGINLDNPQEVLHVDGPVFLEDLGATPATPTGRLYQNSTDLFWGNTNLSQGASLWSVNGANIYRASGNVGIGVTNPSYVFEIRGSDGVVDGSSGVWMKLDNQVGGIGAVSTGILFDTYNGTSEKGGLFFRRNGSFGRGDIIFSTNNAVDGSSVDASDTYARMTVASTGNVGIGITNPTTRLHVNSGVAATALRLDNTVAGNTLFDVYNNGALGTRYQTTTTSTNILSQSTRDINLFTNGSNRMTVDGSSGNVGIGTSTPQEQLVVGDDLGNIYATYTAATIGNTANGGALVLGNSGSIMRMDHGTSGSRIITPGDLFINSTNVGIGTATPAYRLSVNGPANLNEGIATGSAALRVNGDEALWYNGTYFSWGFGGSANFFDDNVGIGISAPTANLHVVGSVPGSSGSIFNNTSNSDGSHSVKGIGANGPTNGYLGIQASNSVGFDGTTFLAPSLGAEIGILGISEGASGTDNWGVIGYSNHWGGRFENTGGNYAELGGSTFAGLFSSNNTSGATVDITNTSSGDASIEFNAGNVFEIGVDNSDNSFTMSHSSGLGSNNFFEFNQSTGIGEVSMQFDVTNGQNGYLFNSADTWGTAVSIANTSATGGTENKYAMVVAGSSPQAGLGVNDFAILAGLNSTPVMVIDYFSTDNYNTRMITESTAYVLELEKNNASGSQLVRFSRNGVFTGSILESGGTVTYNAFTGSHFAWTDEKLDRGALVTMTGKNYKNKTGGNAEPIYGITKSTTENDPKVLGSYLSELEDEDLFDGTTHMVMSVGNGDVWVVDNGEDLEVGDYLISSDIPGHAIKDNSKHDISYVFGKVSEPVKWDEVTETINGKKHKKIHVLFETFTINHEAEALKAEMNQLKIRTSKMEAKLQKVIDLMGTEVSNK